MIVVLDRHGETVARIGDDDLSGPVRFLGPCPDCLCLTWLSAGCGDVLVPTTAHTCPPTIDAPTVAA